MIVAALLYDLLEINVEIEGPPSNFLALFLRVPLINGGFLYGGFGIIEGLGPRWAQALGLMAVLSPDA